MTITNLIAVARILLLPVIIYFLQEDSSFLVFSSLILLLISFMSRIIEYYFEKKERLRISFLDPFSDKIVVLGLLLYLTLTQQFSLFLLGVFILRDMLAIIIRWMSSREDVILKDGLIENLFTYSLYGIIITNLVQKILLNLSLAIEIAAILFIILSITLAILSIGNYSFKYFRSVQSRKKAGKKARKEGLIILVNKRSRGYKDKYRRHLLKIFAKRRKAPIFFLSNNQENLFAEVEKEITKATQIIIAGGDGTFEAALNNPLLQKKPLGFFPLGSGNAYYSYFYKGKRFEYLRSRFSFYETDLDIIEIETELGKRQTTFLGIGVDAEVIRLSKQRTQYGLFDYIAASWKVLLKGEADFALHLDIDGKKTFLSRCVNLTIAKIPYYGFSLRSLIQRIAPHNRLLYAIGILNTHSPVLNKPLRLWGLILTSLGIEKAPLCSFEGKRFMITSKKKFPVQAGGEFLGFTSFLKAGVKRKQKVMMI